MKKHADQRVERNTLHYNLVPWTSCWFLGFLEQFEEASYLNIIAASSNTIIETSFNRQSSLPASDTYMLSRKQQTKFIPGIMTWYKWCFVRLNGNVFVSGIEVFIEMPIALALFQGEDSVLL